MSHHLLYWSMPPFRKKNTYIYINKREKEENENEKKEDAPESRNTKLFIRGNCNNIKILLDVTHLILKPKENGKYEPNIITFDATSVCQTTKLGLQSLFLGEIAGRQFWFPKEDVGSVFFSDLIPFHFADIGQLLIGCTDHQI